MRKLIALLSAAMFVTPAFAGGTVALNDAEPEAIQQATEWRWAIEFEAGRAEINTAASYQSASYDFTNGCTVNNITCTEDESTNFYGLSLFWAYNERYSFGLRYQSMDRLYGLDTSSAEFIDQDTSLITIVARRQFSWLTNAQPFLELGVGRYQSDVKYSNSSYDLTDSHSGWTPVLGAGAIVHLSESWSFVPSLRYIRSVGEKPGITGVTGGNHVKTLDEPVTQLSIGLRFEL